MTSRERNLNSNETRHSISSARCREPGTHGKSRLFAGKKGKEKKRRNVAGYSKTEGDCLEFLTVSSFHVRRSFFPVDFSSSSIRRLVNGDTAQHGSDYLIEPSNRETNSDGFAKGNRVRGEGSRVCAHRSRILLIIVCSALLIFLKIIRSQNLNK